MYGSSMTIMTIGRSLEMIDFDVLLAPAPRRKADGSQHTSFPGLDSESYRSIRYRSTVYYDRIAGLLKSRSANLYLNWPNHSSFLPNLGLAPCCGKIIIDLINRIRVILLNKLLNT